MNISFEKIDDVDALLTVNIDKADCQEKVDKALKVYRQKANIPGFRRGMVPMSLIKRQFEKSVLAEEIDKLMEEKVNAYIKDNKIQMLGMPLPNKEKSKPVDLNTDNFEFAFDIALAPEFKIELGKDDKIPYYIIEVTDEMVNQQVDSFRDRAGKYEKVNEYSDNDMMKGLLVELDENGNAKEDGINIESAMLMPSFIKNEEQKAIFKNAKVNDVLTFNPAIAYENNDTELSSLLKIKKEEVAGHNGNFTYQVEEIQHLVPAEFSQEFFDQVYGKDVVKSEEDFRQKVKDGIEAQLKGDSNYKFMIDSREYAMNKVGKLTFPDALLKRIMLENNKDKAEEYVESNYEGSIKELTWHLIKSQLVEAFGIKVENGEIKEMARQATLAQFAQYGMSNIPEDLLDNYVKQMMQKPESVDNLVNRVIENKLGAELIEKVTLDKKTVTLDEFNKLFQ
ncbi:MAG: trigger factor [Phocaeicola sp.]|uniref:trigger factor n=1 Tax=Phocaeicola TaxID=909656 RepID=UPI00234F94D3|nr:trigger factor [Phocaeicola oris]MCE2616630.1 trigger factor [Phocaeicola oris]